MRLRARWQNAPRELLTSDSSYLADSGEKPVTLACKEIYDGKIKIVRD